MAYMTELKCDSCSSKEFTRKGDYLVCDYCGSRFYSPEPAAQQPAQPVQKPQTTTAYTPTPTPTPKKKKRGKLRGLIIALILIFLVIPMCAAIFEDEIDRPSRDYVNVEAGEAIDVGGYEATIGHAVGTTVGKGSYYNPMYVKAPINIKATDDCVVKCEFFGMDDDSYPDDALPEELNLKSGETWDGFLYLDWHYSYDYRDNDRGLDPTRFNYTARFYSRDSNVSGHWDLSVPAGDSVEVDSKTVMDVMPNTVVRLTATYKESFLEADNPEAVFAMKGTDYDMPVVVALDTQMKEQLKQIDEGDTVVLRGTVCSLQARVESSAVINEVVLRDVTIVK